MPCPPGPTYAAWLPADELHRWWWPHLPDTAYRVEPRVGGQYDIPSDSTGIGVSGEYLELEEPHHILMT